MANFKLLHISDLHMSPQRHREIARNRLPEDVVNMEGDLEESFLSALRNWIAEFGEDEKKPEYLIVSGDVIDSVREGSTAANDIESRQTSTERNFEAAKAFLNNVKNILGLESDEKTAGGLIIPDSAKEKPAEGEIVSVGEGARKDSGELIPMAVKAGDKVLFGKWSGTEVKIDGEELLIMKESDILGIM